MLSTLQNILVVIIGVAGVTTSLVGPLYILLLRMKEDGAGAESERENISDSQDQLATEVHALREDMRASHEDLSDELREMRTLVEKNAERSERNQRHVHQLLVGGHNGEDGEIGNPHYTAEHCPLGDECPWHGER